MNTFAFSRPTDKMPNAWHGSYPEFYERILASLKNTSGTVLEIGVDGGGSLMAYHNWFPNAFVIGMDISPAPDLPWSDTLKHKQQDAYTDEAVSQFANMSPAASRPLMVAIDDGPHSLESQQFFIQHYVRFLHVYGTAIVEDVQSWDHISQLYAKLPPGFIGYGVDLRWADDRYDSILFVAHRK